MHDCAANVGEGFPSVKPWIHKGESVAGDHGAETFGGLDPRGEADPPEPFGDRRGELCAHAGRVGCLGDEPQSASRCDEPLQPLDLSGGVFRPEEVDVHGEHLVERRPLAGKARQVTAGEGQPPGSEVMGVSCPRRGDGGRRPVDGGEMAVLDGVAHQAGGHAVSASDLEHPVGRVDVEELHGPSDAFGDPRHRREITPGQRRSRYRRCVTRSPSITSGLSNITGGWAARSKNGTPWPSSTGTNSIRISSSRPRSRHWRATSGPATPTILSPATSEARATACSTPSVTNVAGASSRGQPSGIEWVTTKIGTPNG